MSHSPSPIPIYTLRHILVKKNGSDCAVCGLPMRVKRPPKTHQRDKRWAPVTATVDYLLPPSDPRHNTLPFLQLSHFFCSKMRHSQGKSDILAHMEPLVLAWITWREEGHLPLPRNQESVQM